MPEETQNDDNAFFDNIIMQDGKWVPHIKFNKHTLGSALLNYGIGQGARTDVVKVMRISTGQIGENKQRWVSPRFEAPIKMRNEVKLCQGKNRPTRNSPTPTRN